MIKSFKIKLMTNYLDGLNYLNLIKANLKGKKVIYSHFARVNNFGDQFNRDLVRYYNLELIYTHSYQKSRVALVGSILGSYLKDYTGVVAGSGFIKKDYKRIPNQWDVRMIRGPLSAAQCGVENAFYADPGILANIVYKKWLDSKIKKYELGILPHSKDVDFVKSLNWPKSIKIIHPRRKPLEVAQDIISCKNIASSSLHGLIFADSFSIPNIHILFGNKLKGGSHKFNDYYLGMETVAEHIVYANNMDINLILERCRIRYEKEYLENKISGTEDILKKILNQLAE